MLLVLGNGDLDVQIMSVLPQLKVYNAIEPDESLRETLRRRLETWGRNIQVIKVKCQHDFWSL